MRASEPHVRKDSRLFADLCDALLRRGNTVQFRVDGQSMQPNLLAGDDVVVVPAKPADLRRGDVVLAEHAEGLRVHRVNSIDPVSGEVVIRSDTGMDFDPPTTRVFGKVLALRRGSDERTLTAFQNYFVHPVRVTLRRARVAAAIRFRRAGLFLFGTLSILLFSATFAVTAAHAQADLAVTQNTAAPTTVAPGGQITYSITIRNNGPNTATRPVFTMATPANTTFVSAAKTGGSFGAWNCVNPPVGGTGTITCTKTSNLTSTSTATFTIVVQVDAATADGTVITNTVNINSTTPDPTPANNTASVSVTVRVADLSMTQTAAPNPVSNGANITYTETVTNHGPTAAAGATLTQSTPANTTFVSATAATGWTCGTVPAVGGTGAIICTANAAMASGTTTTNFTIVVAVIPTAPGGSTITNTATVSETGTDPVPGNNSTTTSVSVSAADLQLTQTAVSVGTTTPISAVAAGSTYSYTEVVTNHSSNTTVGTGTITVYLQTPASTNYQAFSGTSWNCTHPAVGGTGPLVCTYNATLASGASANTLTVNFQVTAGTSAGTTIQSSATVTNSGIQDPAPANNTSITSIVVEPATTSDLALSMSVSPTPVFIFSHLTYTIEVQNLGQLAAPISSNVLTDTLPAGVTFVSVSASSGWACSGTATISCSLTSAMAMGATATIAITVTAPATATTLTNTATVNLPGDPNSSNDSATAYTVVQPLVCATPGRDGAGGTLTGIVNTYYPPSAAGTLASASTSVALGASSGASTPIAAGDLLLIIQMQGATINSTNTSSYGDGLAGNPGSGFTNLGSSGLFEFVTATNAVPTSGGTLQFTGSGPTGGLLNSYSHITATTTQAQQTYQVIRVPQYTSATLGSGLVPFAWNGSLGGVLAIDVSSQLTLGGTVSLDGLGFRGGAGRQLAGGAGAVTDYVTSATIATNGSKGEGIAGTPRYIAPLSITTASTAIDTTGGTPSDTLPGGSYARGAPGNAGGGGTDGDPARNDFNSGGGAGGNGGAGGQGGYGWNSLTATNSTDGGFGGVPFPASTSALAMGGSGGAGTTNNGTYYVSSTVNGNGNGIFSSGGAGGGIVIMHAGSVAGTGTISVNGQSTQSTLNDSTGGGGAAGSILFFANSGRLAGLTVNAIGGSGGNAWPSEAPGGFPGQRHGPGGGGGGGVIFLSAAPASSNVAGGFNGYTDTVQDSFGATPGQPGMVVTTHVITETPGTQPGAYCASADLSVTNSGSPAVVAPGGNITYTQGVNNGGPFDAVNVVFSESIPANTTFQSISSLAGWTCVTPAVGTTGTISCTNPDFASGGTGSFTVVVQVSPATPSGTQIIDVDNITSGTSDPNLANNTATAITTVASATESDLAITNTASAPTVIAGSNVTMTAVVSNNGPAAAATAAFTETIPANTTLGALLVPPAGWSCNSIPVGGTGTFTCTNNSFAALASASFPIVLNVNSATPSGTVISATANISASTPDPNYGNNSATATTVVGAAGQVDLAVAGSGTPNPVTSGNNIAYTQSVTNNGPSPITASGITTVTFTDAIPANTTLAVAFTAPVGWTCNSIAVGATGTFTCTLNSGQTLAIGAIVNFPLVVKVDVATAPGTTITNSPSIASSVTDPNPANNTVTINTIVASPTQADVSISKTASPEPVDQGTNLAYTLTVTNAGPALAQNVIVDDPLPAQVTYTSSLASMGTCTYTAATTTVDCALGDLSVGSTAVITINVTAITFSSSSLSTNTATVSSSTSDPNLANNTASATSTIQAPTAVDLSSFHAFSQADGSVRLVWRTQEESRNLGFHIYREDGSGRHRLDTSLIAGSALLLRGSRPQHAAKIYGAIDSQPSPNAAYWIEDVDVNGTRTLHGPAYAEFSFADQSQPQAQAQTVAALKVSPALSQLNAGGFQSNSPARPVIQLPPDFPVLPLGTPHFNVADHSAVKISVDHEGWYHIPFAQLFSAGLSPNTDLRSLHLYAEGVEQPLLLTGHSSGLASPADAIEFYGTGIDTPFSASRVYWLVPEGPAGKRILPVPSVVSGTAASASFPFTVVREDRSTYFAALLNGENNDNFFGDVVTTTPVDETLAVANRDTSSSAPLTLDLSLQGVTDAQQHSVSVQFNGSPLGTFEFFGQVLSKQTFSVDPSLVLDGTNTVTLASLNGDYDVSLVQSIQLHYLHTYTADAGWLRATAEAGSEVHISGLTNSQVRVFDITDPLNIFELDGKLALESTSYGVTATLPPGAPGLRTLLAFSADALSAPLALAHHSPLSLASQRAGADIVIVTHPDFVTHLVPLVRFRESQGYRVNVVTTDQIFDQFNYGERSPFAIRGFLQDAASHWQRKPQALLLVGDASLDPRNYLGFGDFDFVPTRIIETAAFKTASDDWFTDFQQQGFASIPTGRLPVRTTADVDLLVSRIVSYENGEFSGPWNTQALLIADQNVDANFTSAVTSAAATLPASLHTSQLLADGLDPATARSQILAALNNGALLVNYNGHGAEQQWSFSDLFNNTDAAALTNGGRLPVYLLIDCLNGLFQDVYAQSLAESLLLAPNGGAIAVWASSGFTDQPPQASMNLALLHQLAAHPGQSLGRLILNAKAGTTDSDVRRTWILFGDPALKIHFAAPAVAAGSDSTSRSVVPRDTSRACQGGRACAREVPGP